MNINDLKQTIESEGLDKVINLILEHSKKRGLVKTSQALKMKSRESNFIILNSTFDQARKKVSEFLGYRYNFYDGIHC